jgi:AAA domain
VDRVQPEQRRCVFASNSLQLLKELITEGPAGNRWFKVNLHVHGQGNESSEIIAQARASKVELIAVVDHQSFQYIDAIMAAATTPGRPVTVLPGIEITTHEGGHIIAIFPQAFAGQARTQFIGWLEIPGTGNTSVASRKNADEIFNKVEELDGVVVIPHPFTENIGLFSKARKISTKVDWLATGHIHLMQISEDKIRYIAHDSNRNWVNRYVLHSATDEQVTDSTYCLAPFNRSDAHESGAVGQECSWFRMAEPTVEGLKQVACEPRTRISRVGPQETSHDCILAVRVSGGYCDGQIFKFNDGLNCLVGDNHSGKSAVLDFLRFALVPDEQETPDSAKRLLKRMHDILGDQGTVEVFVRQNKNYFVVKRTFKAVYITKGKESILDRSEGKAVAQLNHPIDGLIFAPDFRFPLEVYEQGKVSKLREDIERQLDMLDEFAELDDQKRRRQNLIQRLTQSAATLKPLYQEKETLNISITGLGQLEAELAEKEILLPNSDDENMWTDALSLVDTMEDLMLSLKEGATVCSAPAAPTANPVFDLAQVFRLSLPSVDGSSIAESETLSAWAGALNAALDKIEQARLLIVAAETELSGLAAPLRLAWQKAYDDRRSIISGQLAAAGIESPKELISRVDKLRAEISAIKSLRIPRFKVLEDLIAGEEQRRQEIIDAIQQLDSEITEKRTRKADELTDRLDKELKLSIKPAADYAAYKQTLTELSITITTSQGQKIHSRDNQIDQIVQAIRPLELAKALRNQGTVRRADGSTTTLQSLCRITDNTTNVLCSIGKDIDLLNKLQIVSVPDVPQILVRRRRESTYAPIHSGLSPGEQSAAILSLALETRKRPLILDQPEDELGYGYVVNLIVPKMLSVKFTRQLIVVTHDANIPVLGDADHVIKMENQPKGEGQRACIPDVVGCFESASVTAALLELEGGRQAFHFRKHRYDLPKVC